MYLTFLNLFYKFIVFIIRPEIKKGDYIFTILM